jgi:ribosomal protein L32/predicted GIY-YIG superfamily endonuclease
MMIKVFEVINPDITFQTFVDYLYIVEEVNTGFIKIGYTCDVRRRLKELEKAFSQIFPEISSPKIRLITLIPATSTAEAVVHWFLREEKGFKEWYPRSPKVCMVIELIEVLRDCGCILGVIPVSRWWRELSEEGRQRLLEEWQEVLKYLRIVCPHCGQTMIGNRVCPRCFEANLKVSFEERQSNAGNR